MGQELAAIGGDAYLKMRYWWWSVLVQTAVTIGMMVHEGPQCPQGCDCDPGLPAIPVDKVCGNTAHRVSSREVRAALERFDAWEGHLASVIVEPFGHEGPSPLGQDGAADFLRFVEFLRSSEGEGFVAW